MADLIVDLPIHTVQAHAMGVPLPASEIDVMDRQSAMNVDNHASQAPQEFVIREGRRSSFDRDSIRPSYSASNGPHAWRS